MGLKDKFQEFAIFVGKNACLKKLFRKPYDFYKQIAPKRSLANFKKHGFEALYLFNKCLTSHGYHYTLAFGTLLGAIREKDFISHDDDIDVAMWIQDYSPELIDQLASVGIKLKYSFSVDNDRLAKEDTFSYKGVLIDIFYFYREDNGRVYCCDFVNQPGCHNRSTSVAKYGGLLPRKLYMPLEQEELRVMFRNIEVSIPNNYEEILSFRYGNDYMTPKPGWKPKTDYIKEIPNWVGIFKTY